jgi:hypothetical protein
LNLENVVGEQVQRLLRAGAIAGGMRNRSLTAEFRHVGIDEICLILSRALFCC